jgi:hypothetical protein
MKMMILYAAFLMATSFVLPSQTNAYYITEESHTNAYFTPTPEQIERAIHANESRPAKDDPEGNWGKVSDGFQLSVRMAKNTFTNGEPVIALILLRNVSDKPLTYYVFYPKDDDLKLHVKMGDKQLNPKDAITTDMTFLEKLNHLNNGSRSMPMLPVGVQRLFKVRLDQSFDLTTNGQYSICASRAVLRNDKKSETNVSSGIATFSIR